MSIKNTLLIVGLLVVIVGGFAMWNKQEVIDDGSFISTDGYEAEDTAGDITETTLAKSAQATSPKAPLIKKATPTAPAVVAPTRVFENGQYVSIVSLTNSGFSPQAITIVKGESVRFVNRSGNAMRIISTVASAEYSGLNQEKSVGLNGIYELSFPKGGTYAFGNGKASTFVGVVNVQ